MTVTKMVPENHQPMDFSEPSESVGDRGDIDGDRDLGTRSTFGEITDLTLGLQSVTNLVRNFLVTLTRQPRDFFYIYFYP